MREPLIRISAERVTEGVHIALLPVIRIALPDGAVVVERDESLEVHLPAVVGADINTANEAAASLGQALGMEKKNEDIRKG